jgi:acyl carrier protein
VFQRSNIQTEVIAILRKHCGLADAEVRGDDRLQEDLGLESVQLLSLALEAENSFEIVLEEPPESPPRTVNELVDLIALRLAERDEDV